MSPKFVNKKERKAELAEGALAVFARVGFEKASISQIAGECGVGKGTVYEYFASKEALFLESVMVWMKQIETEIGKILSAEPGVAGSELAQLTRYLEATFDAYTENPYSKRMSVVLTHLMIGHQEWIVKSEFLEKSTESFRGAIKELLGAAVGSGELPARIRDEVDAHAINLIAGMDGLDLHATISANHFDSRKQSRLYIKTYLDGLKPM